MQGDSSDDNQSMSALSVEKDAAPGRMQAEDVPSSAVRVVYACDDNYAPLTAISAVSLLKHNPDAEVFLLGCDLRKESIDIVKTRVEKYGGRFRYVDAGGEISRLRAKKVSQYVSYAVYSRIFIGDLFERLSGKVLYLDCDTLVTGPVDDVFSVPLGSAVLALAPDAVHPAYKRVVSLSPEKPYYNTGVALIDLDGWRRRNCTERLLDELENPNGRNPLGDQDIIVRVLNDETVSLDRKWNYLSQYILYGDRTVPVIYHFSGNTLGRPWTHSSRHPMRREYMALAAETGLAQAVARPGGMPLEYRIQYLLYRLLPRFLFRPVSNLMLRLHIRLTYSV